MLRWIVHVAFLGVVTGAWGTEAWCQDAEGEQVRFVSCDGVTLRGLYYPGSGRTSPAVVFLNDLGDDSGVKSWAPLATALAAKGYAVLTFDFRGQGDSTEIDANAFWSIQHNRALVRGHPDNEIFFKNFDSRYYSALVNDIAAAKAFLDRRNDAGMCHSGNLIVIGARHGATLGALWVASEFHRFEVAIPQFPNRFPQVTGTPEGKKILCALWVNMQPQLGKRRVNLPGLIYQAGVLGKLPMVFLYGDEDKDGRSIATKCVNSLLAKAKLPLTLKVEIPNAGNARGADLLKGTETIGAAIDYLESVRTKQGDEWAEHDFRKTQYVWKSPNGYMAANMLGNESLNFNTFESFLPSR